MSLDVSRRDGYDTPGGWRAALDQLGRASNLTGSGAILLAVVVVSWVVAFLVGGRPLYLLSYAGLFVLAVSWIIGRRPLPLEGRRADTRPRFAEGETIQMEVALVARRRVNTFILEDRVPPLLGRPSRVAVASVEPGQEVSQHYSLTASRRGVYEIGPLVARWGDPFGLTQRETVLAEPTEVLVHPTVEPVRDRPLTRLWEDPPIRPPRTKPWPSGMEFYGMREYQPGDDLRMVVWRAFARTGRLLVRESEQGITDKITIILDQDHRNHSSGVVSESFEVGARAAASLGVRHLREGYQVTLEGNARRLASPLRGRSVQVSYLDALARAERERAPVTDAITRLVGDPRRDAHIVVITPLLDAVAAARLKLLLERGASVLVAALIWDEEDTETLGQAASIGCQVIEIRPQAALAAAFHHEVGAGRL